MTPPWSRSVVHMVYFVLRAPLCLAFAGKVQSFQIGGSALVPFLVNAMFDPDRRGLNLGQEKAKKNVCARKHFSELRYSWPTPTHLTES